MTKRIEMDLDPVPPEMFDLLEPLKKSDNLETRMLAVAFLSLARKFNFLIGKFEFGDVFFTDTNSEPREP